MRLIWPSRVRSSPWCPGCWLAFGSEGRLEQTLDTDQDNGIVFVPESERDTETLRQRFLRLCTAGQ
ncbi:MAG: hypothetical protein IPG40_13105 [Zoogloea sp.]|nr:hypothetical protein [Zoogloea sp.]